MAEPRAGGRRSTGAGRGIPGYMIPELPFFTLFFLYVWLVIEPHLIFHGSDRITNFPSFYGTWRFFTSHLSHPGGPVEYLSAFLSQLFCFSWLGAMVITIQAWAFGRLTACRLKQMGVAGPRAVVCAPALILLMLYARYTYFFPTTTALLCALALASLHRRPATGRTSVARVMSFAGLSLVCYYAAGAAMLAFAVTGAIPDLFSSGRRRLVVPYALVAAGLPYVLGVGIFGLTINSAYSDLLPVSWKLLHFAARRRGAEIACVLYALVPIILAAGGVVSVLRTGRRRAQTMKESRDAGRRTVPSRCVESPVCRWLAHAAALVAAGAAVACGSFDGAQKTHFAVDYFAYHKMWPEVLIEGRKSPEDPLIMHAVNRALYHTGQLGDNMFAWPQNPAYLLLAGAGYPWVYWQDFAVHMELGFINFAENALMECLAGMGDRPMILQQLATINMVKGNLNTARVYLHTLSATVTHRGWAKGYLRLLERDPNLATDPDVRSLRSIALEKDYPSLDAPPEVVLVSLLETNPANRMAFEYLMAWYLSNRQLTRFVKRLDGLHDLGYRTLPRHYEEAVMVYAATARTTIELPGYEPRDQVRRRIEQFLGILQSHGGNRQAAFADLAQHHGDTYAFYNVYGPREKAR